MERRTVRIGIIKKSLGGVALAAMIIGAFGPHHEATAQTRNPVRVMCLGDSLTSSINGYSSYRYWLSRRLEAAGYRVDFVGTLWGVGSGVSASHADFDQDHDGHPGASTDDIMDAANYYAMATKPQVVLLLIGGTDFEQGKSPQHALLNTRTTIGQLRRANPNVSILWAMLPPAPGQTPQVRAYNSGVLRYASMWSTPKSPIRVVNLFNNFYPAQDTVDGVHTNERGEKKFAARFYIQLAAALKRYGQ